MVFIVKIHHSLHFRKAYFLSVGGTLYTAEIQKV